MPTLPTPTTWRTVSVSVKRSNRVRLSSCRVSRYSARSWPTSSACSASLIVTLTGGSTVIRGRPPAMFVSLANAPWLVRRSRFFSMCTETRPRSAGSK